MFGGTGFYLGSLGLEHNTANALKLQGLENSVDNEGACVFAALLMYWVLLFPICVFCRGSNLQGHGKIFKWIRYFFMFVNDKKHEKNAIE